MPLTETLQGAGFGSRQYLETADITRGAPDRICGDDFSRKLCFARARFLWPVAAATAQVDGFRNIRTYADADQKLPRDDEETKGR
jgi:hypothetical protein